MLRQPVALWCIKNANDNITMKTLFVSLIFMGLGVCVINAQVSSSSGSDFVQTVPSDSVLKNYEVLMQESQPPQRGIVIPFSFFENLDASTSDSTIHALEKYLDTLDASSYDKLRATLSFYREASIIDRDNSEKHTKKAEEIRQTLIKKYPRASDTYLLMIDENTSNEEIIQLAKKAIKADRDNMDAWMILLGSLSNLHLEIDVCAEIEKLKAPEWVLKYNSVAMECLQKRNIAE